MVTFHLRLFMDVTWRCGLPSCGDQPGQAFKQLRKSTCDFCIVLRTKAAWCPQTEQQSEASFYPDYKSDTRCYGFPPTADAHYKR
jgi:hypothetical protein